MFTTIHKIKEFSIQLFLNISNGNKNIKSVHQSIIMEHYSRKKNSDSIKNIINEQKENRTINFSLRNENQNERLKKNDSSSLSDNKISFSKLKAQIQKIQSKPWHIFLFYFKQLQFNCLFLCNQINTFQYSSNQFDKGTNASILKLNMHPKCQNHKLISMIKQFKSHCKRDPLDFFVCKLSNNECIAYDLEKKTCLFNPLDYNLSDEKWFIGNLIYYDEQKKIVVSRCESICEIIINMYINDIYYSNQCIHCNVQHLAGIDMKHKKTFQIQEMIDVGLETFLKKQIEASWIKKKYFEEMGSSHSSDEFIDVQEKSKNISLFDSTNSSDAMSRSSSIMNSKESSKASLPMYCNNSKSDSRMSISTITNPNSSISSFIDVFDSEKKEMVEKSKSRISSYLSRVSDKTMDYLFQEDSIYPNYSKFTFQTNKQKTPTFDSFPQVNVSNHMSTNSILMSISKNGDSLYKTIEYLCTSVLYYCHAIQNTYKINSLDLNIRNVMVQFVNNNYPVKYHNFSLDSNSKKKNIYFVYCFKDQNDENKLKAIAVPFKGYIFKCIDNGMSKLYNVTGEKNQENHIEFSYFYYQSVFRKNEYKNKDISTRCKNNRTKYGIGHKFSTSYDMYYFFASLCNYLNCFKIYDTMAHHIQEKYKWFLKNDTLRPPIERFYDNICPKDVLNYCFSLYDCKIDKKNENNQSHGISFEKFTSGDFLKEETSLNIDSILSIHGLNKFNISELKQKHIVQYCEKD